MTDPSMQRLSKTWSVTGRSPISTATTTSLRSCSARFRAGDWTTTVAVHDGRTIVAVWPDYTTVLGVAFDIGSTTVAGHLCDLASGEVLASAGAMNPQIRFGEDLFRMEPRVLPDDEPRNRGRADPSRPRMHRRPDHRSLHAGGRGGGRHLSFTVVGNPIMHHLFLGLDPTELGGAPFALATDGAVHRRAADLDLHVHPGARVCLSCRASPGMSARTPLGHPVGGAIPAGDREPDRRRRHEPGIVLGNRDQVVRRVQPHRPGVRRRADQLRSTGGPGRDRTRPDRRPRRWSHVSP